MYRPKETVNKLDTRECVWVCLTIHEPVQFIEEVDTDLWLQPVDQWGQTSNPTLCQDGAVMQYMHLPEGELSPEIITSSQCLLIRAVGHQEDGPQGGQKRRRKEKKKQTKKNLDNILMHIWAMRPNRIEQ